MSRLHKVGMARQQKGQREIISTWGHLHCFLSLPLVAIMCQRCFNKRSKKIKSRVIPENKREISLN